MASKNELLQSIRPGMRVTKVFFKCVYAYEITYPGFSEQAITALEAAGCSRARQYYNDWVSEYEKEYEAMMRNISAWYSGFRTKNERQVKKTIAGDRSTENQFAGFPEDW